MVTSDTFARMASKAEEGAVSREYLALVLLGPGIVERFAIVLVLGRL